MQAVEARFCDDVGFHYSRFLQHLDPNPKTEMMYVKRMTNLRNVNDMKKVTEDHPVGDLESVLKNIKTMVRLRRLSRSFVIIKFPLFVRVVQSFGVAAMVLCVLPSSPVGDLESVLKTINTMVRPFRSVILCSFFSSGLSRLCNVLSTLFRAAAVFNCLIWRVGVMVLGNVYHNRFPNLNHNINPILTITPIITVNLA